MSQWVLNSNGNFVPRRTLRPLKPEEVCSETETKKRQLFENLIARRWGTSVNPPRESDDKDDMTWEEYEDDEELQRRTHEVDERIDLNGTQLNQQPIYDTLLNTKIQMQVGYDLCNGTVKRRAVGPDNRLIGTYDDDPMKSTMVYEVEFPNGESRVYSANILAEHMLNQIDEEPFSTTMLKGILNYSKDERIAVSHDDIFTKDAKVQRQYMKTTKGWKLLVQWEDNSQTWIPLMDM